MITPDRRERLARFTRLALRLRYRFVAAMVIVLSVFLLAYNLLPIKSHKVWKPSEVPIAFWTWQSKTPNNSELEKIKSNIPVQKLFIRAGQIDLSNRTLSSIRAVEGHFPTGTPIVLVYNATPDFLNSFESFHLEEVSKRIFEIFSLDVGRATADGSLIVGIQLDLDIPTRLLGRYAILLGLIHKRLQTGMLLSITGLPTWLTSPEITKTLDTVDFWIPQCYGARIPERIEQRIPIASPADVAQTIRRVRELRRPFYAGLAAYGYAIHYRRNGGIIELRGDLDPKLVATSLLLEFVDTTGANDLESGENRYQYRALEDCSIDGVEMRKGESLVLNIPTTEGLRVSAKAVRAEAGPMLLGILRFSSTD